MAAIIRILIESSVRATVIAMAVATVLLAMRVKSPVVRHRVWIGVLAVMLLLPAISLWSPQIEVRLLPPVPMTKQHDATNVPAKGSAVQYPQTTASRDQAFARKTLSALPSSWQATNRPSPTSAWSATGIVTTVYLLGLCAFLARLLLGMILAGRMSRGLSGDNPILYSSHCRAPLSVGLWRLRILLPLQSKNWSPEKLSAVLAHEREHLRRHDPRVEWFAHLNRSIYWFHPLAWWLSGRLTALAEEACDEAVLSQGHDPVDYIAILLELARSVKYSGALVAIRGSSIGGSTLALRIRKILTVGRSPALSRARVVSVTAACGAVIVILSLISLGHAQGSRPGSPRADDMSARAAHFERETPHQNPAQQDVHRLMPESQELAPIPSQKAPSETKASLTDLVAAEPARSQTEMERAPASSGSAQESTLPAYYAKWLNEDVIYIIAPEERSAFLALQTNEEREAFIEQFWSRREQQQTTIELAAKVARLNELRTRYTALHPDVLKLTAEIQELERKQKEGSLDFKTEHYRRLAYANEHFACTLPGWKTDRGRIYILYGAPEGKEAHPSFGSYTREFWQGGGEQTVYPFERWRYAHIDGVGDNVTIEFIDLRSDGNYRLAQGDEKLAASELILARSISNVSPTDLLARRFASGLRAEPNDPPMYRNGQYLIPDLEIYHAAINPTTGKPNLQVSYRIEPREKIVAGDQDFREGLTQLALDDRIVITGAIPIRNFQTGNYILDIQIIDRISNATINISAGFRVLDSPQ